MCVTESPPANADHRDTRLLQQACASHHDQQLCSMPPTHRRHATMQQQIPTSPLTRVVPPSGSTRNHYTHSVILVRDLVMALDACVHA